MQVQQNLTNEQKAQLLLSGCLYREQGKELARRIKPGNVGHDAWMDDPLLGEKKEGRAILKEGYLSVCNSIHDRFFIVEIPLESIEIIEQ